MLKTLRRKVIRDLRTNWGQFLAVWLIVVLGTTFYGGMYPAAVNFVDSLYSTYDRFDLMDFHVKPADPLPQDSAALDDVRGIEDVVSVEGRLVVEGGLQTDSATGRLINLRLISVPDDRPVEVNRSEVITGRDIQAGDEILILESFANVHDIAPGDTVYVTIGEQPVAFNVAGLVFNPEYLVNSRSSESSFPTPTTFGVAWLHYSTLAELSGQVGAINEITIRLTGSARDETPVRDAAVRAELSALFPNAAILHREQIPSGWMLRANINGVFPIMQFFSGLFLAEATVITGILMARVVETERRRIGTLRAMGVTRRELVLHYLTFGFLIGVSGGLVGSVLGYITSFWFMYSFLDNIAGGSVPGFENMPQVPFMVLGLVIVTLGSTLSGVYPAWSMSGTPPGVALRPAAPKTPNALSRIKLAWLPLPIRQAIRNLLRAPGRAAGTALGVMAGAMMVFSALAMWDTLQVNFDDFFASTAYDVRVDMGTVQPGDSLEAQVAALDSVEAAQASLVGPVAVVQPDGSLFGTAAIAVDERDSFFALKTVEGEPAFSGADGVWIGHNLARALDIETGDTINLRAFDQEHSVAVKGIVSQTIGSPVFVPRSLFVQWTPGGIFPANSVLVRVADGQAEAVRAAAAELPGVRAVEILAEYDHDINGYLDYYRLNTLMFGAFGLILTLALVFNTVNASVRERHEELTILRALGTKGYEIALMITLEFMVMVVIGMAVGMPLGRLAGYDLTTAYDTEYYGVLPLIKSVSYAIGIGLLLVTVLLAEIPGLRAVQRADLGDVCKSQSF